jgi:hypothetical protein
MQKKTIPPSCKTCLYYDTNNKFDGFSNPICLLFSNKEKKVSTCVCRSDKTKCGTSAKYYEEDIEKIY